MTPQDILTADEQQVELWIARLEGYRWSQSSERGHWEDAYGNPVNFGVPKYTTSLDAIWPVQAKTIKKVGSGIYHEYLCDVIEGSNASTMTAKALPRARAICLCTLDELNQLVQEDKK
jgi:hypothetical protein